MKYTTVFVKQLENRKGKPWQARAKYKDVTGKWKETSKVLPEAKGKKEAMRMAREWMDALNREADMMPSADRAKTFEEVFLEYHEHQLATGEIERSTYYSNMMAYKTNIKPYLGDYMFAEVNKVVLNGWLTKLYQRGLAQSTIHGAHAKVKKVYNYYYETGELLVNPFKGVKIPKKGENRVTHLTDEQMDKFLSAVYIDFDPTHPMYVGILLAFYAGLRRGEICGLRWNDIDFYKKTITIRTAVGVGIRNDGTKGGYTKNPKNRSSNRTFPMLPQLEDALLQRKKAINPEDHWFVTGGEKFMLPETYSKAFLTFVRRNDLVDAYGKHITSHGLRHNFATVGIRAGMDIASLSLMMGHASRAMTLDTYGDANADALNLASVKLGETFNEKTEYFKLEDIYDEVEEDERRI